MLVLTFSAACSRRSSVLETGGVLRDDTVTVASFNFPESELLAELYAQAMEGAGIPVWRELHLGPRELVDPALARGLVEFVPRYAGTALLSLGTADPALDRRDLGAVVDALLALPPA